MTRQGILPLLLLLVPLRLEAGDVPVVVDDIGGVRRDVRAMLLDGRFPQVEQRLEQLVKDKPVTRNGDRLLEYLYSRLSADPSVERQILEWRANAPSSRPALILSGEVHLKRGWRARGEGWAKDVAPSQWPEFEGELKLAQADFERAYGLGSEDPNAATGLISVFLALPLPRASLEQWYSRAVQSDPGAWSPRYRKLLSLFPKWGGSWPEAEAFATEMARRSPPGSRLFTLPLYLLIEQADRSEDVADFLKSPEAQARIEQVARRWLAEFPRSTEARLVLGKLKARAGDRESAVSLFSEALEIDPETADLRLQRGIAFYRLKRYDEAAVDLERARDLKPEDASVWLYLGRLAYYGRDDATTALSAFERAATLDPTNTLYLQERGMAKVKLGRYEEAIQDLSVSIAKRPERARAYLYRGKAYRALDRSAEADRDFAEAVRLEPLLAKNVPRPRKGTPKP